MSIETVQHGFIVVDSPRGNDATGQRDSWTAPFATLSRAFEFIQDHDTVLIYPGPYMETPAEPVDTWQLAGGGAALWLRDRRSVTLRGVGRPEVWFVKHGNGLTIENCSDIRVENIEFKGAGMLTEPLPYYFALLLLQGGNDGIQVRDCVFKESGNHGIGHLWGPRSTHNSVFENNYFVNGGHMKHPTLQWDGAAIAVGGSGNRIYGNRIERWLRGIEIESGVSGNRDVPTAHVIISHNKLLQCWWQHITVMPTHQKAEFFDQIIIEGNLMQGWGVRPPQDFDPEARFSHEGIYFGGGVNAQIRGNAITDMWDGCGLRMTTDFAPIRDSLVTDNRISNVDRTGIHAVSITPVGSFQTTPGFIRLGVDRGADGEAKIMVDGTPGQTVQIQRLSALQQSWTYWQTVTLNEGMLEVGDPDAPAAGQVFYRGVVLSVSDPLRVNRCRFANNKVGPVGGRGIWIHGDYNVVDSNGIHQCGSDQTWQGVYLQGGRRNTVRRNRLIDALPFEDRGAETQASENDVFWQDRTDTRLQQ